MDISANVAYLAALSAAAERLVEIIRGIPWFALPKDPAPAPTDRERAIQAIRNESTRVALVNALAVITGVITAIVAYLIGVLPVAKNWAEVTIYGVLAGAGSGFWNAVLAYLLQLKNAVPKTPATVILESKDALSASGTRVG